MKRRRMISELLDEIDTRAADGDKVTELFRSVASNSDISASVLRYHYYKRGGHPDKCHGRQRLTDDQSENLEQMVTVLSISNKPIEVSELPQLVEDAFGIKVSTHWAYSWAKRRKKLFQPYEMKKSLADIRDPDKKLTEEEGLCDAVEEIQNRYNFTVHKAAAVARVANIIQTRETAERAALAQSVEQPSEEKINEQQQKSDIASQCEHGKRERESRQEIVDEQRRKRVCIHPTCTVLHKGGKKWSVCERCDRRSCPRHKDSLAGHHCPDSPVTGSSPNSSRM